MQFVHAVPCGRTIDAPNGALIYEAVFTFWWQEAFPADVEWALPAWFTASAAEQGQIHWIKATVEGPKGPAGMTEAMIEVGAPDRPGSGRYNCLQTIPLKASLVGPGEYWIRLYLDDGEVAAFPIGVEQGPP